MNSKYILQMEGMTKQFPGVLALDAVSLYIRPGSVHALMGENGAGKSTLMKCLFGMYHPDAGTITFKDKEVKLHDAKDAIDVGITMIHQELSNVPERTVAQNIWLGREPLVTGTRFVNEKKMYDDTAKLLKDLNMDINPNTRMSSLSISMQQGCEIAKAVSHGASLVVMDEPTSSLSDREVDQLFKIINELRSNGVAVIYISHRMDEIFQIADEVSVMRDGKMIMTKSILSAIIDKEKTMDEIISAMVGRSLDQRFPDVEDNPGEVVLEVNNLSSVNEKSFQDISIDLRKSEILGIGGLVGAQRSEFVEAIFGLRHTIHGGIKINGKEVKIKSSRDAIEHGIGLITEDRRGTGIFPLLSITENTFMASLKHFLTKIGLIKHQAVTVKATDLNKLLKTKTPTMNTKIQNLSGGNQQKVLISRWLMTLPDILIMDEPTRGIDVGAKFEIYTIMADLVKQGKSIIMVSSEMPELLGMSHRVAVLCNGRLTGVLDKKEATQEAVMRLATQFS